MSDSDSDDEFKELFDAFDQLHEEDTTTAAACSDNNQLHGAKFDPYAPKQTLKEAEQATIDSLKRKRPFEEPTPQPSKVARTDTQSKPTMKTGITSKPAASSSSSSSKPEMAQCPLSGLRYRSFEKGMNLATIKQRIDETGAKFVHLNSIANGAANKDLSDVTFATIGILTRKVTPSSVDKKGNKFTIFSFSNLRDIPKTITIMGFGQVHQDHWKTQIGAAVLLLEPKEMANRTQNEQYKDQRSFVLPSADKFVVIGFGADLGTCTAKTKAGSKCTNFVNLQTGQLCTTHVMQQYTRAAGARGAFSAKNGSLPDKYKGTMWDKVKGQTFFGGGQMAQALPPSINPASSSCDRLSKLANSHAEKFVKEVKKNPGIMINSGVKRVTTDDTNKMVQSSRHGGRLLAAALGQSERNESLLQSRKVKTGSKELKSISAAELLKQKNAEFLEQRKEAIRKKKLAAAMAQSAKKVTAPNNDKLIIAGLPPSQNMFTKLQQVKPRITPESLNTNERAKLRAAMLLKEKNAKKPKTPPKSNKDLIMEKVDMNRAGKKPTKTTTTPSPKEKKMTFLGKTVESKDVKEIFKKKSMYHDTIENLVSAQKDFYFSILEKKEEIAMKMDGVMKAESQAVTCKQCKYTYWSPHENCKKNNHELKWSKVTKRWFQCSNCPASRCITMDQYPRITCANCGSSTKWKRSAANDTHVKNITEASSLLVRGEERKWVNS